MNEAFNLGREDYYEGEEYRNPFIEGSLDYYAYEDGWNEAEDEDIQTDFKEGWWV